MATLYTVGSWTSGGYTGTLATSYTETTDITTNVSNVTVTVAWSGNRTSATLYGNGLRVRVGTQWWTAVAAGGNANTARGGLSHTFTVPHNNDGTGSVTIYTDADISGGNPDFKSKSATVTLTTIPRGHTFTLSETMISAGQSVTLTATKNVEAYRSTITYDNGVTQGEIGRNQSRTSWEISYDTLAAGLPTGVTRNAAIICNTVNYDTGAIVSTTTLYVAVNTGHIALSLYDDGNGVGATVGERATAPGFWVKGIAADFTQATEVRGIYEEIKGTNIYGRKWANGFLEYFIDKYVPAGGYTSWQGHYYRDYDVNITFPTAFSSVQGAVAGYSNATCYSTQTRELSNTKAPTVRLMAFTNQSSMTGNVHIYIWGYWK